MAKISCWGKTSDSWWKVAVENDVDKTKVACRYCSAEVAYFFGVSVMWTGYLCLLAKPGSVVLATACKEIISLKSQNTHNCPCRYQNWVTLDKYSSLCSDSPAFVAVFVCLGEISCKAGVFEALTRLPNMASVPHTDVCFQVPNCDFCVPWHL